LLNDKMERKSDARRIGAARSPNRSIRRGVVSLPWELTRLARICRLAARDLATRDSRLATRSGASVDVRTVGEIDVGETSLVSLVDVFSRDHGPARDGDNSPLESIRGSRDTMYQSPLQQGPRSEGMPSLDPRVPIGQDSGTASLRHVRRCILADTSGWFARLTSK